MYIRASSPTRRLCHLLTLLAFSFSCVPLRVILLQMHHNFLHYLPAQLFGLLHLSHLSASHNHLTALPPSLGSAPVLKNLCLHHNQLTALPTAIGETCMAIWRWKSRRTLSCSSCLCWDLVNGLWSEKLFLIRRDQHGEESRPSPGLFGM